MIFLVVFSTVTLFRQSNEIAKFTSDKPAPLEISAVQGNEAAVDALTRRLESFRNDLDGESEATLALTPDEMNLAIAAYPPFSDLRGMFRVVSIDGETMRIAISYRLNGKPRLSRSGESGLLASDARFLNATLVARPGLLKREFILGFDTIEVPGAMVPKEFIEQMSPYRIAERYLTDPVIGPAMGRLTRVGVSDGRLVLKRVRGETPADAIGREQVDSASNRLFMILGIVACVFLVFAGIIVFLGLRAKAKGS